MGAVIRAKKDQHRRVIKGARVSRSVGWGERGVGAPMAFAVSDGQTVGCVVVEA